ncbi:MAG TPA: Ni/Fe-hydrogenase cytochrome b subunit [Acidobacteriaceae bacterium]
MTPRETIAADESGATLINHWQSGVPVMGSPIMTPFVLFLLCVAVLGLAVAALRFISPLGPFSGMNDAYAWGIWKTFNVMTLTALGSGPLALGLAAWVFNRQKLHVVMRTALVVGFLFYATGLTALGFDVGRPWNFYSALMPWRWNTESAMLEISICMPVYCAAFLSFEILPLVLERLYYTGNDRVRANLRRIAPAIRKIYPYFLIGAYIIPLMHQSSLGGLLLLAGTKIDPLWQSPVMPLLYLIAAILCGFSFIIFLLLIVCLRYSRSLDVGILEELARLLSWTCIIFLFIRFADIIWRHQLLAAFSFNRMSLLFLSETALILIPTLALQSRRVRQTPRTLLNAAVLACIGGMFYRFIPTSIAYMPAHSTSYFPSVPELVMAAGYIAAGSLAFVLAINYFAVLPGPASSWDHTFRHIGWPHKPARFVPNPPPVPAAVKKEA